MLLSPNLVDFVMCGLIAVIGVIMARATRQPIGLMARRDGSGAKFRAQL